MRGARAIAVAAENPPEGMGGDHKSASGGRGLAQLGSLVEAGLVPVEAEGQHVAHVGLHLHGPDQDDAVKSGEFLKLVAVPWPGVLGNAEAPQPQPVGFEDHVLRGETAVAAALGSMDMQVEESGHRGAPPRFWRDCCRRGFPRSLCPATISVKLGMGRGGPRRIGLLMGNAGNSVAR